MCTVDIIRTFCAMPGTALVRRRGALLIMDVTFWFGRSSPRLSNRGLIVRSTSKLRIVGSRLFVLKVGMCVLCYHKRELVWKYDITSGAHRTTN